MTEARIGLLGGTFNPIHCGHLILAERARAQFGLDRVLFIPNHVPPHRRIEADEMASKESRLIMCVMATLSNPAFHVSTIELDREGSSYTFDTVAALKKEIPSAGFHFICGADALTRHDWHRFPELMEMLDGLLLATRQEGIGDARRKVEKEAPEHSGKIRNVQMPIIEISATEIRNRVRKGESIRYFVPESVEEYIIRYGLYGGGAGG